MFGKVFHQIFDSSIAEDYEVRHVFMDFIVLADLEGIVDKTHESLARQTNVPIEIIRRAIAKLESPDPTSRSTHCEGRRIVRLNEHRDWGWKIVNYTDYRGIRDEQGRRSFLKDKSRQIATDPIRRRGYVYYARSEFGIKIGFSSNPWSRVHEMKVASPTTVLVATEPGDVDTETARHEKFKAYHVDREWFKESEELIKYIKSLPGYAGGYESSPGYAATTVAESPHVEEEEEADVVAKRNSVVAESDCSDGFEALQKLYPRLDIAQQFSDARAKLGKEPPRRYFEKWLESEQKKLINGTPPAAPVNGRGPMAPPPNGWTPPTYETVRAFSDRKKWATGFARQFYDSMVAHNWRHYGQPVTSDEHWQSLMRDADYKP